MSADEKLNGQQATAETEADVPATGNAEHEQESTAVAEEAAGAPQAAGDVEALMQELESWKQKAGENHDRVLRAQAELDNLRKRTARDIENAHRYALDKFVAELLPVIDSIELGIEAAAGAEDITSLREGMDLTLKKFADVLGKFGVVVVDPTGEKFDPEKHEAVSMLEAEDGQPGTVITVMQKGYQLNGRLVRPAMVVVAK